MKLRTLVNEIQDEKLRAKVEQAIRECLPEQDGEFKAWIHASPLGDYYEVILQGPIQRRQRIFARIGEDMPDLIRAWIGSYPLS